MLPSQGRTAFWGQGLAVRALRGAGSPSYSLFFFLWELAVLKTSFLRTIFFWVKGEKCSISSKWKALSLPALGTFPRSFFPLREEAAPCKGEKRGDGRSGEGSEEVGRKAPVTLETSAVSIRKPEGLFVLDQAWRLEQDWVRKRKAHKRVESRATIAEWGLTGPGSSSCHLMSVWGSVGTKKTPTDLPERNPMTGLRGSIWSCQSQF